MKEKIIKILESQFSVVEYEDPDTGFTESTTIDVLTTDEFPDIVNKLEILVNQEVEKRIAERMPSEEEIEKHFTTPHYHYEKGHYYKVRKDRIFGANWLRSRLTNPGVNDSQKTEGGTK